MNLINRALIFFVLISLFSCSANPPKLQKEDVSLHPSCQPKNTKKAELDEDKYVRIGGVQQWVTIKGKNCSNPVVLMAHGGPGNPLSPYHDSLFQNFEENFTIVHWDQRGSGKTYAAQFETGEITLEKITNNNLSVDLLVSDGLEVSDYIRKRLGHKKIIISGSSWGSFLATKMAHSAPNKYHFYVGLSQIVNGRKLYTESYIKVKSIAIEKNDQATLNILNSIGPPFWSQPASFGKLRRIIKRYEDESVSQLADWKMANEYLSEQTKRAYIFGEEFSFLKFIGLDGDGMVHNIALDKCCTQFKIPIYIIQGQKDLLTVPKVTREYFKKIKAPEKEYIALEHSAHDQTIEMLRAYIDTLNAGVSRFIEKAILPAPKTSN